MKDQQREILNQVAAGTMSAEEGAARLEELERPTAPAGESDAQIRKVKILSRFGNTEVVGDSSVASAVAEGPHRAHQEGDTIVIEQSPFIDETTFEFSRPPGRAVVNGFDFGRKLIVRMNPSLPLVANVQAGSLRVDGVHGDLTSEVQAGNCIVSDFRGALKLGVTAGNVTARGRLDGGTSAIRCEMGQVKVSLDRASSVRITARTTMGKVAIEGAGVKDTDAREVTVGSGAGTLDCECTMGNIKVSVD